MSLKKQLESDLKDAMRQRDQIRRDTLRLVLNAVHNAEIDAGSALDDAGVQNVLSKEGKRRRESIEEFAKAKRDDLVQKEESELAVISAYLPEQVSREDLVAAARQVVEETGASGQKDIGKVMPVLMQRFHGRADGRAVNEVVRELLGG
ncbi:MAG: GatB/YqeY domain-containing protein [Dehalococcoidia bacterium]